MSRNFIAFDLEGPLSPQDNAYDLMRLFPGGERVFEVISRYDDLLTLEGKEGYQPGDTLALIVPFLFLHGVAERDIVALAEKASLTGGAAELIFWLGSRGWKVFCITTTYEQYASCLARKLGIPKGDIASTGFPLDRLHEKSNSGDLELVSVVEDDIIGLRPVDDDDRIKKRLDAFFWESLPATSLGAVIEEVKPVGGQRKVDALTRFAAACSEPLSGWVAVGDSITDSSMLRAVDEAGGLAIAFNANEYAIPHATMSLASTSIKDLAPVLEVWEKGGCHEVEKLVRRLEKAGGRENRGYFYWLAGCKDFDEVIRVSKRIRRLVREEAGKLG